MDAELREVRLRRHPRFVARTVGEHQVLLPAEGPKPADVLFFLLDGPVALHVWELLEQPRQGSELVSGVVEAFDVSPDVASHDVGVFLNQLLQAGCAERLTS